MNFPYSMDAGDFSPSYLEMASAIAAPGSVTYDLTRVKRVLGVSTPVPVVEQRGERLGLSVTDKKVEEHCGKDCTNCPCGGKNV